jgi:sterol desaturase/sphingolipid hydroxylase (fatty acid hydroxylase superfamily)
MKMDLAVKKRMVRNVALSLAIYTLPPALMLAWLSFFGQTPWSHPAPTAHPSGLFWSFSDLLKGNGFIVFIVALGLLEFSLGRFSDEWRGNETVLDIVCFTLPRLVFAPFFAWFSLTVLPSVAPREHNAFSWVPLFWAILIIAVADDLTHYWYHRLHHEVPLLWRFHRTHHSAPYMGMSMASRQNAFFTVFFSQTYVTSVLVYLGLGPASIAVLTIKSIITTTAHSSVPWDKPLYEHKVLHPVAWVLERFISTPATHHAHHAASTDDGVGHYKGNFGNMFFLWNVIFGTALISRRFPKAYGISHYRGDPWYAQVFWPVFKSNIPGSELAPDGPVVRVKNEHLALHAEDMVPAPVPTGGD